MTKRNPPYGLKDLTVRAIDDGYLVTCFRGMYGGRKPDGHFYIYHDPKMKVESYFTDIASVISFLQDSFIDGEALSR